MDQKFIGDYQLIKMIGQGLVGAVYLAEHKFTKRQYAIKVLPPELSSDRAFIKRFEEEVAFLSTINHPNIVRIHDISFADGQYFIVCDCVVDNMGETTNLAQFLSAEKKPLDEEVAFVLLEQIANALDWIHRLSGPQGACTHFGLNPNNLLLGKEEKAWKVYVSDIGLTRVIGTGRALMRTLQQMAQSLELKLDKDTYSSPEPETAKLASMQNAFMQSFSFLAPEQKHLSEGSVGSKVDVYAFGLLAYYFLTKQLPEGLLDDLSIKRPNLKFDWERLIRSCLSRNPEERPDLLVDLLKSIREGKDESQDLSQQGTTPYHQASKTLTSDFTPSSAQVSTSGRTSTVVKQYKPELREAKEVDPILTEIVVIPAGKYSRGSADGNRDERPCHEVELESFAMDVHPVTNEQYLRFLDAVGSGKDANNHDLIRFKASRINKRAGKLSIESGYVKHPVVGVTWYGAAAYAKWVGKRLPTEAEWEVAAKGGEENARYPFEGEIDKTKANFFNTDTTPVMSYPANPYGIFDLAGNVYEWCQDWYGYTYYETSAQEPFSPKGPIQGIYRVLRGACWKSVPGDLELSRRHKNKPGPEAADATFGFRCVTDVEES